MDWIDIGLHALGALAFTWFFSAHWPKLWHFFASASAGFWILREYIQHDTIFNSAQSILEWLVPTIIGFIVALITSSIFEERERKCSCDLYSLGDDD